MEVIMDDYDDFDDLFNISPEFLGESFIVDENTDLDAIFAQKLIEEDEKMFEMEENDAKLAKRLHDEEMARQLQEEESKKSTPKPPVHVQTTNDDALIAQLLQEEFSSTATITSQERDKRMAQQFSDEEFARKLQEEMNRSNTEQQDLLLAKKLADDSDAEIARQLSQANDFLSTDEAIARQLANDEEEEERKRLEKQAKIKAQEAERIRKQEEERLRAEEEIKKMNTSFDNVVEPGDTNLIPDTGHLKVHLNAYIGCEIRRILKPDLRSRYEKTLQQYKDKYGHNSQYSKPVWAFHGTKSARMSSIEQKGLLVPGSSGVTHATDSGWYGRGIYLSPNCQVSLGYSDDGKLLICAVLMGKIFKCRNRIDGAGLQPNCDSHESPEGNEFIVFNPGQVLPVFVIDTRKRKNNYPIPPYY
jgi:hypothetical protein